MNWLRAGSALALIVTGTLVLVRTGPQSTAAVPAVAIPSVVRSWPSQLLATGEQLSYTVSLKSSVQTQGELAGPSTMGVSLAGTLQLTAMPKANLVHVRLIDPQLMFTQGNVQTSKLPSTLAGLAEGRMVAFTASGRVESLPGAGSLDRFADQLLQQLAAGLQTAYPADHAASRWFQAEIDGTGGYMAHYAVVRDDGSKAVLKKSKSGYQSISQVTTGQGLQLHGEIHGDYTIALTWAEAWPNAVHGEEKVQLTLGQGQGAALSTAATTQLDFVFKGRRAMAADQIALLNKVPKKETTAAAEAKNAEHLKRHAADRLQQTTIADIADGYARLKNLSGKERSSAQSALYDQTIAWIRLHDDNLKALQASLKGLQGDDFHLRETLSALAYVGCSNCQEVLVKEIMSRTDDPAFATGLVNLLSQPKLPGIAAEQALQALASSPDAVVKNIAQLSLGTVANKLLGSEEKARGDRIVEDYMQHLNSAPETSSKLVALAVLGNTGSVRLAPAVESLLSDPSENVRVAAVSSLRNLPPEVTLSQLSKSLSDSSADVRLASIRAFGQQAASVATGNTLAAYLGAEASPVLRSAAIERLGIYYRSVPAAKAAIDLAAKADASPQVRNIATRTVIMYSAH